METSLRATAIFIAASLIQSSSFAADTGPVVFELKTANVAGSFIEDRKEHVIKPGANVSCGVTLREISEHLAGEDLKGWHLEFEFVHPELEDGKLFRDDDLFWNGKKFESPFVAGYAEERTFLDPFADPPHNRKTYFDEATNALVIEISNFGGMTRTTYTLSLSADRKAIRKVAMESWGMGITSALFRCSGSAPLTLSKTVNP